jgi:hypothetical protein
MCVCVSLSLSLCVCVCVCVWSWVQVPVKVREIMQESVKGNDKGLATVIDVAMMDESKSSEVTKDARAVRDVLPSHLLDAHSHRLSHTHPDTMACLTASHSTASAIASVSRRRTSCTSTRCTTSTPPSFCTCSLRTTCATPTTTCHWRSCTWPVPRLDLPAAVSCHRGAVLRDPSSP